MVIPSAGAVVLVPFPFSDLSSAKLRPAVVLADAGRGDWRLRQGRGSCIGRYAGHGIKAEAIAVIRSIVRNDIRRYREVH